MNRKQLNEIITQVIIEAIAKTDTESLLDDLQNVIQQIDDTSKEMYSLVMEYQQAERTQFFKSYFAAIQHFRKICVNAMAGRYENIDNKAMQCMRDIADAMRSSYGNGIARVQEAMTEVLSVVEKQQNDIEQLVSTLSASNSTNVLEKNNNQ